MADRDALTHNERGGKPLSFFDLSKVPWARVAAALRYNGQQAQTIVPREQYDALILGIESVNRLVARKPAPTPPKESLSYFFIIRRFRE